MNDLIRMCHEALPGFTVTPQDLRNPSAAFYKTFVDNLPTVPCTAEFAVDENNHLWITYVRMHYFCQNVLLDDFRLINLIAPSRNQVQMQMKMIMNYLMFIKEHEHCLDIEEKYRERSMQVKQKREDLDAAIEESNKFSIMNLNIQEQKVALEELKTKAIQHLKDKKKRKTEMLSKIDAVQQVINIKQIKENEITDRNKLKNHKLAEIKDQLVTDGSLLKDELNFYTEKIETEKISCENKEKLIQKNLTTKQILKDTLGIITEKSESINQNNAKIEELEKLKNIHSSKMQENVHSITNLETKIEEFKLLMRDYHNQKENVKLETLHKKSEQKGQLRTIVEKESQLRNTLVDLKKKNVIVEQNIVKKNSEEQKMKMVVFKNDCKNNYEKILAAKAALYNKMENLVVQNEKRAKIIRENFIPK